MARARIKMTGKAKGRRGQPPVQPTCQVCHQPIEPGQRRYEWSFRYGGTYARHVEHGAPRPSELTQSMLSELYGAQESVEDVLAKQPTSADEFEGWRSDVASALNDAAGTARDTGSEYEAAAEPFGGQGPNQERYEACESWADELDDASSEVENVDLEEVSEDDFEAEPGDEEGDLEQRIEDAKEEALQNAIGEVTDHAENAIGNLEL